MGAFLCAQSAGKYMTEQGGGIILNMASAFGVSTLPQRACYCSTTKGIC